MKYRNDFVTNSSSSSFVLSFKDLSDITNFSQYCNENGYEEFLELIESYASDSLSFVNSNNKPLSIRVLIDKLKDIKFPHRVAEELQRLYDENYIIEPYKTFKVQLNDYLKGDCFDVSSLNFKGVDGEDGTYFIDLITNSRHRDKDEAINILKDSYLIDYHKKLINENVKPLDEIESYADYLKREQVYKESKEYKDSIEAFLSSSDYMIKKQNIEDADLVLNVTIWDSYGGLLEWAIRNGFIEDNFSHNCVVVLNVG